MTILTALFFFRPPENQTDAIDNAAGGEQNLASVARVAGAGHLKFYSAELYITIGTFR